MLVFLQLSPSSKYILSGKAICMIDACSNNLLSSLFLPMILYVSMDMYFCILSESIKLFIYGLSLLTHIIFYLLIPNSSKLRYLSLSKGPK